MLGVFTKPRVAWYACSTSTIEAEIETYAKGLNMLCRVQERTES